MRRYVNNNKTVRSFLLLRAEISCLEVDICDPNASCQHEEPLAKCVCNPGYEGDGTTCSPIGAFIILIFFFNFCFSRFAHDALRNVNAIFSLFLSTISWHAYRLLYIPHYHVNWKTAYPHELWTLRSTSNYFRQYQKSLSHNVFYIAL